MESFAEEKSSSMQNQSDGEPMEKRRRYNCDSTESEETRTLSAEDASKAAGETDDGGWTIDVLNDDCLLEIFLYLPIEDRIRLERVSKRWRTVIQASWPADKNLTLAWPTWKLLEGPDHVVDREKLEKVLRRCGSHLRSVYMSFLDPEPYSDLLSDLAESCPNLQALDMGTTLLSTDSIRLLGSNCPDIRELTLNVLDTDDDSPLIELFVRTTKLTHLWMHCSFTGDCFMHLPPTIREIVLCHCDELELDNFTLALPNFGNLAELAFGHPAAWMPLPPAMMKALRRHCKRLKVLDVSNFGNIVPKTRRLITDLASLEVLRMDSKISDAFLLTLSRKCPNLAELDINSCGATSAGIEGLAGSPRLEKLSLNPRPHRGSAEQAWGEAEEPQKEEPPRMDAFASLKYLVLRACYTLTPGQMLRLVESAPALELVKLFNYPGSCKRAIRWLISQTAAANGRVKFEVTNR